MAEHRASDFLRGALRPEQQQLRLLGDILTELRAIRALLAAQNEDAGIQAEPACPHCGGTDLENTSCSGEPNRSTCRRCGRSFGQEVAANG